MVLGEDLIWHTYIFAEKILNNELIEVYDNGKDERDFTYIDDIVDGIISSIENNYNFEIFNLGNNFQSH